MCRTIKSVFATLTFLGTVLPIDHANAYEWQAQCGTNSSKMVTCKVKKGDAILEGAQGTMFTYTMPDKKTFKWFMPNGTLHCNWRENTKLKMPSGSWFTVSYAYCDDSDSTIKYQLGSGNVVFISER